MDATSGDIKTAAYQLIDALPQGASWDDLMYRVWVRQCIDAGLDDAEHGRIVPVDEVRQKFGLAG